MSELARVTLGMVVLICIPIVVQMLRRMSAELSPTPPRIPMRWWSATKDVAKLLDEARELIQFNANACAECECGVLVHNDPFRNLKIDDACPDCAPEREWLERVQMLMGPPIADVVRKSA
jgi:hypothetical protein